MTKEERVLKAVKREYAQGLPVCFSFIDEHVKQYFEDKLGVSPSKFKEYIDNDIQQIYIYDDLQMYISNPGAVKYAIENGFAFKRDKEEILYDRTGVGWAVNSEGQKPVEPPLRSLEDVEKFEFPLAEKAGMFEAVKKDLKQYKQAGYAVMLPQYYSLFEKAWVLMGYENFLISCYEDKDVVIRFLDKITEYRVKITEQIVRYPITLGHTGDDYGTQNGPIMALDMWRELFKPRLKRIWDVFKKNNIPIVHHTCGDCRAYIDDMIEIGLDVLHPVQASTMPIEELSEKYADRLTFFGGVDCQEILTNGTPADVIKNIEKTVKVLGKNNGLILAPINIMANVKTQNLKVLLECVNAYRVNS